MFHCLLYGSGDPRDLPVLTHSFPTRRSSDLLECKATAVPLSGVDEIRTMALAAPLDELADRCGVAVDVIRDVARRCATAARGMCITHTGVSHTPTGPIAEWLATVDRKSVV